MTEPAKRLKCCAIGDNGSGKTTSIMRWQLARFCQREEVPTVFFASKSIRVNDIFYDLHVWDSHKPEEHDRLRRMGYDGTDVVIVCFPVVDRMRFENVGCFWVPEIRELLPGVPWVLVGTKSDLRGKEGDDEAARIFLDEEPVSVEEGKRVAKKMGAVCYVECSAHDQASIDEVFKQAAIASQVPRRTRKWKKKSCVIL